MQITNKFIKIKKFYLDLIILALKHFESHFLCTKVQLEKDIIDILCCHHYATDSLFFYGIKATISP